MHDFLKIQSLSELFRFMEFPSPKHPLIAVVDFSKTIFEKELPQSRVVCDFYQISFKSDKNGFIKYGRELYDYQEGSLVYVAPGQVMEYANEEVVTVNTGWTLFFHADLIRSFSLATKMKTYEFFSYQANEALHISEKEKEIIASIIYKIQTELNNNIDDFSEELIVSNLELLLNYSKRFYNRQFITRKRFSEDIVVKFENLLDAYFEKDL